MFVYMWSIVDPALVVALEIVAQSFSTYANNFENDMEREIERLDRIEEAAVLARMNAASRPPQEEWQGKQ